MNISYKTIFKVLLFFVVPILVITTIFAHILVAISSNFIIQLILIVLFVGLIIKPIFSWLDWLEEKGYLD